MKKQTKIMITILVLFLVSCSGKNNSLTLRVGHNHTQANPSHLALQHFAKEVTEKTNGDISVEIFPNNILGDDRVMLEQVQQGALDMMRINSATLENFDSNFSLFSMPYLFYSNEHFIRVMNSPLMDEIYTQNTNKTDIRILSYQDTGVRGFYTKNPILVPEDLNGKKIRVLSSQNLIQMMALMGATATPMPYGEVYMALQQGIIDGAENNVQALTLDKHGEVTKFYAFSNHLRLPDFLAIGEKSWNRLSEEQKIIVKEAAVNAQIYHQELWDKKIEEALNEAKTNLNISFNEVDIPLFQQLVEPMYKDLSNKNPELSELVINIRNM